MYPRYVEKSIQEALADTPVVSLNGPRQSGKTTLVRKLAGKDWNYITLDDATVLESATADPAGFIRGLDHAIIDEIQRAPELLLAIKRSVDEDRRPGRFLLTGSAHILTIPKVRESLAGRMEVISLYPLSHAEVTGVGMPTFLDSAFRGEQPKPGEKIIGDDLMNIVLAGGYPEALARANAKRRRNWFHSYLDALIEHDVRDIAAVERIGELRKLINVLAQFSGQLTNLSQIGGRIDINYKTVDRYITVLEQIFLIQRLRPWFRNELKRLVKTPKIHFLDAGLLASIRGYGIDRLRHNRAPWGAILESFVFAELLKQVSWSDSNISFYHYRDKDQIEVDIVLENEAGDFIGVEVKGAASVKASDFKGLERLSRTAPESFKLGIVLYDGDQVLPFGTNMFAAPVSCLWK